MQKIKSSLNFLFHNLPRLRFLSCVLRGPFSISSQTGAIEILLVFPNKFSHQESHYTLKQSNKHSVYRKGCNLFYLIFLLLCVLNQIYLLDTINAQAEVDLLFPMFFLETVLSKLLSHVYMLIIFFVLMCGIASCIQMCFHRTTE